MLYVLDTETDGLLDELTRIWIAVALSVSDDQEIIFCDLMVYRSVGNTEYRPLKALPHFMEHEASGLVGHNLVGFDLMAIEKVLGYQHRKLDAVFDTMLMSQAQNYCRFGPEGRHSMEIWGRYLGNPKQAHEDWKNFSEEMVSRCRSDVVINKRMFKILNREFSKLHDRNPLIAKSLRAEHYASWWAGQAELHGWPFNVEEAEKLLDTLNAEILATEQTIEPLIPPRIRIIDAEPRIPAFKRDGTYYNWVCAHFPGLLPDDIDDPTAPLQVLGPYQRFEYEPAQLGSVADVKKFLYTIGWQPDEWTYKRDPETGRLEKKSPKLSDSSLQPLGRVGELLIKYYTLRSRRGNVLSWLEQAKKTGGRVFGSCFTIATPTHRARHAGIVNVPSADALFGKEIRQLFMAAPGYKIIGADSKGNQLRGLCHDLQNEAYTREVVDGDVHTFNANILKELYPSATRGNGKRFIYAYLFGAGAGKLAFDLTGVRNTTLGSQLKELFANRVTGLKSLVTELESMYSRTEESSGYGYIRAIDGRPIFADSKRKVLNYRLQSTEGITCKCAIMVFVREMFARYPDRKWQPLIFMHDETQTMVPADIADDVAKLAAESFRDGPKLVGVQIMDGDSKVGNNWYETH